MQVAPVKKVLGSVAKMCGAGNRVVFDDEEGNYIENKKTGQRTWMTKRNGVYFYEMWVRKGSKAKTTDDKPRNNTPSTDADGDIDMNKRIMQVQNKNIKDCNDKILNLETKIDKIMAGFTGLSLRS